MIYATAMTLGEYITTEINLRGWDVAKLARELGVSWQRAQRLAQDEPKRADGSPPTVRPETIDKVAKALRVEPRTIMDKVYFSEDNASQRNGDTKIASGETSLAAVHECLLQEVQKNQVMLFSLMEEMRVVRALLEGAPAVTPVPSLPVLADMGLSGTELGHRIETDFADALADAKTQQAQATSKQHPSKKDAPKTA